MVDEEGFLLIKDREGPEVPLPDNSASRAELEAVKEQLKQTRDSLALAKEDAVNARAAAEASAAEAQKAVTDLSLERSQKAAIEQERAQLQATVTKLQEQLEQARKDLANQGGSSSELVEARKKLAEQDARIKNLESNVETYRSNAANLFLVRRQLEAQVESLKKQIEELKQAQGSGDPGGAQPPSPPQAPPPIADSWSVATASTNRVWGPGRHAMETLRNINVGLKDATHEYAMAMSFRAKASQPVEKVWYYVPYGTGYHGGTAGSVVMTIRPDLNGAPDPSKNLGFFIHDLSAENKSADKMYEDNVLNSQALESGKLYWLVFTNNTGTAGTYYSINTTQIRKYSGAPGIRWTPPVDATVLYQTNPGSWTNLTSVSGPGDMQSSPLFQVSYRGGVKQGSAVIESGATALRSMTLTTAAGRDNTKTIREALYIPNAITVRAVSFMAEVLEDSGASVTVSLHQLEGSGLSNTVVRTLWSTNKTLTKSSTAPVGTPAGWAASYWHDINLDRNVSLTGDTWYALDITVNSGSLRVAGQTNARRRGLEMPVAYIDGEARYALDNGSFIPLNYHFHGTPNAARNDVNWRGVALHTLEDIDSFYPQDGGQQSTPKPGQPQNPDSRGGLPVAFHDRVFSMSTGNNPKLLHAWNNRVSGAVQNGTTGQGGGASVVQGKSQRLTMQDGWLLDPWKRTGNLDWVLRQTFLHYTPWFVFIEIEGSPARAPRAEVAIRNLRFWILPKGSDTWELLASQSTGFWAGYFHPNMSSQIGGDIRGAAFEGGEKFQFKGDASPWPVIHGSGAQYRFQDDRGFDGLMVTCEARIITPGAEVALQLGCDAKIFGDNKSDRVWVNESDHGWYPGVGLSRCEPLTASWQAYGFSPLQQADGTVRDGRAANALTKATFDASKVDLTKAPELGR